MMSGVSPITHRTAEYLNTDSPIAGLNLFGWRHPELDVDTLWISEAIAVWWLGNGVPHGGGFDAPKYTVAETDRVRALVMTYLWRSKRGLTKKLVLCKSDQQISAMTDMVENPKALEYFQFRTFDSMLHEAEALGYQERALRTLEHMDYVWHQKRTAVTPSAFSGLGHKDVPILKPNGGYQEDGMTYATLDVDTPAIYEWLCYKDLIATINATEKGFVITPQGHEILDERRRKGLDARGIGVFVVQRFDPDLDAFLKPVFDELSARLSMSVGPVWAQEHIEKIDERIFRRIRDCQAVLLHVTNNKFNVGLEAGYALALGKPVVAFREKPGVKAEDWEKPLPFDIATLNCHEYESDCDKDELADKLYARLLLAMPQSG